MRVMPNTPTVSDTPKSVNHWMVPRETDYEGGKEEIFLTFDAVWQGRPVVVKMNADRYTVSDGQWTDWRIYAVEAREDFGPNLTDLAQSRLGTAAKPAVLAWLNGPNYAPSRRDAFLHAMKRIASSLRYDSRNLRSALAQHGHEIDHADQDKLATIADAFDHLHGLIDSI